MNKKCTITIVLLLLVIVGGIYKFIFQGAVSESTDGRIAVHLDAGETDLVLMEMRMFLEAVQQIVKGVNEDDMKLVAEAARRVGKEAQEAVPGTLMGKLPIELKKLGFDTHTRFDQMAMDAEELGDGSHALEQLATLMQNCVACHSAYRLDISSK